MKNNTRRIVMVVIGAYLAYTGFDLTTAVIGSSENNKWLFLVFAFIFLVFGVALIIMNLRLFLRELQEEKKETDRTGKEEAENRMDRRLIVEELEEFHSQKSEDREGDSNCV